MEVHDVSIYLAFGAGFLSFISPCVLPLIPSYITFLTGISFEELTGDNNSAKIKSLILLNSIMFIMGFSIVFIAMGASISLLGSYFSVYQGILRKVGGVIMAIMGLHIIGVVNFRFLQREKRLHIFKNNKSLGLLGSFFVGIGFAAGWTPCIGPILASILMVAGTSKTLGAGVGLLAVYSLGLAVPFLLVSLGIEHFLEHFHKIKKYFRIISITSGIFLIFMGVLIYSNYFAIFTGYLNRWFPFLIYN
ncbi:MAG: cytochrome c biogenesis CcdA family protein [Thermodesulfobacteriota bacterium]